MRRCEGRGKRRQCCAQQVAVVMGDGQAQHLGAAGTPVLSGTLGSLELAQRMALELV